MFYFSETVKKYKMLKGGERVVIGFSGGADSSALIWALNEIKEELRLELLAVHINHGIREKSADEDELHCKKFCERLDIPFKSYSFDIPAESKKRKMGEEECGRLFRYEVFSKEAGKDGLIATAHNLNDRAETLIFNLARGTGLNGLSSIVPVRDNIIRPLIDTDRKSIEEYCCANKIPYVNDETNCDDEYTRNNIRHNLLPKFIELNPNFLKNCKNLCEDAESEEMFFDDMVAYWQKKDFDLKLISEPLRRRMIKKELEKIGGSPSRKNIEEAEKSLLNGKPFYYKNKMRCFFKNTIIEFQKSENKHFFLEEKNIKKRLMSKELVEIEFNTVKIKLRYVDKSDYKSFFGSEYLQNVNNRYFYNIFDCDKIANTLLIRSRVAGDFYDDPVRHIGKSLKKLYNEKKVPVDKRVELPVLLIDDKLFYTAVAGVSKQFSIDEYTKNVGYIEFYSI
ncbi:MAG: tRNA lysidine(34) synthetase TilS [Candidatus Fimenecus sp.]